MKTPARPNKDINLVIRQITTASRNVPILGSPIDPNPPSRSVRTPAKKGAKKKSAARRS